MIKKGRGEASLCPNRLPVACMGERVAVAVTGQLDGVNIKTS